ncbi:hypothetical protein TNCV_565181 [Trichonephila clavipes]|nr:hypothetical protein TNCV_565181 [Trichonephila clavipes]
MLRVEALIFEPWNSLPDCYNEVKKLALGVQRLSSDRHIRRSKHKIKMGRTILLERRQSESVGRRNSRTTFLRSDWPRPFARREVGVEMDWVDPKINDPRQGFRFVFET